MDLATRFQVPEFPVLMFVFLDIVESGTWDWHDGVACNWVDFKKISLIVIDSKLFSLLVEEFGSECNSVTASNLG